MRTFFLFILFSLPFCFGNAQPVAPQNATKPADSIGTKIKVPTIIHFTNPETDEKGVLKYSSLDTTLDEIQLINPAIKYFYNDLSNVGSAADPQLFRLHTSPLTYFGNFTDELYEWKPEDVRYYKTNKKFSELDYHQGGGHEQAIKVTLAENIFKNWNVGIDFHRIGAQGFLTNGKTFHSNFDVFTWYHTLNDRYHLFASAIWNTTENAVNGGVSSDSLVKANDFSNAELLGVTVKLPNAFQHRRNHVFSLNHFFDINSKPDTNQASVTKFRFRHDVMFESSSNTYFDNTPSFYDQSFFNPTTLDSMHYYQLKNKFSFTHFIETTNSLFTKLNYQVAGGYQWFEHRFMTDSSLITTHDEYENWFEEAQFNSESENKIIKISAGGQAIVSGDNKKSYSFDSKLRLSLPESFSFPFKVIEASGGFFSNAPSLMEKFYLSNHFFWSTNFLNIQGAVSKIKIEGSEHNFDYEYGGQFYGSLKNYIFFNSSSLPEQSTGSINVEQFYLKMNFKYRSFHFNNTAWWQKTSAQAVIHLPELLSHHSLYYESAFLNKKLFAQIGFDVHFTSGYYSNAYNPAVSIFYLQDSFKTNNYPLTDFFINFRIKSARIFLKFQNIGDNLFAKNYYETPHYPMPGMVFQLGIVWRFFD